MDYQELKQLEDDLWEAADQLRANSKLTASEYSMPVLGLIFLRHATTRFYALLEEVENSIPARATGQLREDRIKLGFQGKAAIYLPEIARYEYLASLPASENIAAAMGYCWLYLCLRRMSSGEKSSSPPRCKETRATHLT